jgi:hypothetical protein
MWKVMLAAALLLVAAPAAQAGTVTGVGIAQVDVKPGDPKDNASIVEAVEKAEQAGIPKASKAARDEAKELADAFDMTLGAVVSVEQGSGGPYGYGAPYGVLAPFGPDRYCGTITRVRRHRTKSGKIVRVRTKTRRCYVPSRLVVQLSVTFEATPSS